MWTLHESEQPGAERPPARILRVTRGEVTEVYRVALLDADVVSLERYTNGAFEPARVFRGLTSDASSGSGSTSDAGLDRAVRYVARYLDGSVNVGERDLLSPTSALARNVRWLPGDIQMLNTAFHYAAELFPSAQFHVTQLFRRVFGDLAFVLLIVVTAGFWLQTDAPVPLRGLALALQLVALVAIIGFDRYWEPIRFRWRKLNEIRWSERGLRGLVAFPAVVVSQLVLGTVAVVLSTLLGLTNLVIHPLKVFESWRQVRRGKTLEWRASSVSAGQDMRGWPLAEFVEVYRPAWVAGVVIVAFAAWLVLLGAPPAILGLNSVGLFVASFLTAFLYAWYSALPHAVADGAPQYRLTRSELGTLLAIGFGGLAVSVLAWSAGVYPLPAFDGSVGYVALFLTGSAAFAVVYPLYYRAKGVAFERRRRGAPRVAWGAAAVVALVVAWFGGEWLRDARIAQVFHVDEAEWRMPETERRVYAAVFEATRRHGKVDPEPLLRAVGEQPTLRQRPSLPLPDLAELRGLPAPKLPQLSSIPPLDLPELHPLPESERVPIGKPQREFVMRLGESVARPPNPALAGQKARAAAQRRALRVVPRRLAPEELAVQEHFVEHAAFPWIARDELARLGAPNDRGERLPLLELARVFHWHEVKALWDRVALPGGGALPERVRLRRLSAAIDGVSALGRTPSAAEVERFLKTEAALVERWSREYANVPLGDLAEDQPKSRFAQLTQLLLEHDLTAERLAEALRLDYVHAFWRQGSVAPLVAGIYRDRPLHEPWEKLELDWEGHALLRERWLALQTEQVMATRVWQASGSRLRPSPEQLRRTVRFLEQTLGSLGSPASERPHRVFSELFALEGVDRQALERGDTVAALLAARLWTQTMSARLGKVLVNTLSNQELPGDAEARRVVREVSRLRYPDDGGDDELRRALDWLVLVDHAETYRELAAGHDQFVRETRDRGLTTAGVAQAAAVSERRLMADLVELWRELPRRFPGVPARDDRVAELIVQTAYFSSPDGKRHRTPREFLRDFAGVFRDVERLMPLAPPELIERFSDRQLLETQGRTSRSARGRRFLAWWTVAVQTRVVQNNLVRNGVARRAAPEQVALAWAEVLRGGQERWPRLPWLVPGFAEYFLNVKEVRGWSERQLWSAFDEQLTAADRLLARHVVPFKAFEDLVDVRIRARTGSPNFDPVLRQANATVALAQLLAVVRKNGIERFDGNPALLTEAFAGLYEHVKREFPRLYWEGEGMLEFYLLLALARGWDPYQVVARFDAEWSLASALAADGWLERLEAAALGRGGAELEDTRAFIRLQARRLQEKTGLSVTDPRARATNALIAVATLMLSAAEEGVLPLQHGEAWSQQKTRAWAASLAPRSLDAEDRAWAAARVTEVARLERAMREHGPHFPWHKGSILETHVLMLQQRAIGVDQLSAAAEPTWRVASELVARRAPIPSEFTTWVLRESMEDLKQKLARARGTSPSRIADAEVLPDDPALIPLNAQLVLADVLAQLRLKFGVEAEPAEIARRLLELRREGPRRYASLPWGAKGFAASLVVASYEPDFRDDFWRYAEFVDLPAIDRLLADLAERRRHGADPLPAEVIEDVRASMRLQTGRTPSSEDVVAYQAARDGLFLLKEFLPELPRTLDSVITLARLRAAIRARSGEYAALHLVTTAEQKARSGFAERLAVLALKKGLGSGLRLDGPGFVALATELIDAELAAMNQIYERIRQSFSPEEMEYYQRTIRADARRDNPRRASKHGLQPSSLSVPEVLEDDVVADFALYELHYAREIGQSASYVADVFDIFCRLAARPEQRAAYRAELAAIDRPYQSQLRAPGSPEFEVWSRDPDYATWWQRRGEFIKKMRGRYVALARTFALVKHAAFSSDSDPEVRAAFARFGGFDQYLTALFDALMDVPRRAELLGVLRRLEQEDAFLADGVAFAWALLDVHVVRALYPDAAERERVLGGMAGVLPALTEEYRRVLGFEPRLESGVPFYDAREARQRADVQAGAGREVLRRADLVQRSVQRWTQSYVLKHAYKVLFFRDLDEADPTPVPRFTHWGRLDVLRPFVESALQRIVPYTRGDVIGDFLEERLPERLTQATGSRELATWIEWLAEHGELGLDGERTGRNGYRDEIAGFERRLAHYRGLAAAGEAADQNVRAEQQRVLDLEREYASFTRQVGWLREAAERVQAETTRARRDYREAIWVHAVLGVALALLVGACWVHIAARVLPPRTRLRRAARVLGWSVPLALVTLVPLGVARWPDHAAAVAEPWLTRVRLLERDAAGRLGLRGAAAQLAKVRPWGGSHDEGGSGGR